MKKEERLLSKRDIQSLTKKFASMCSVLLHRRINVVSITGSEMGYTVAADGDIYLNFNHNVAASLLLPAKQRITLAFGVCVHELLHLLLTSFPATKTLQEGKTQAEGKLAHQYLNILEDARIEYHAPSVVGKKMCSALSYMQRCCFNSSPSLQSQEDALSQYVTALIQYGDKGKIKGSFTDEEAKNIFTDTIPLLDESKHCLTTEECVGYAQQVFDISRPLWESQFKKEDEFMEYLKKLISMLSEAGLISTKNLSGGGNGGEPLVSLSATRKKPGGISDDAAKDMGESLLEDALAESVDSSGNGKEDVAAIVVCPSSSSGDISKYQRINAEIAVEKKLLCKSLEKIFANDRGKETYVRVGKYQPVREFGSRETQRVCTKRITPDDKQSMAMMVLIDESGSMLNKGKIETARKIAVLLAEVAAQIDIPIALLGFTADDIVDRKRYPLIHTKYLLWNNSQEKRKSLVHIEAKANNADAYSIRYASKLLAQRSEKHKLLLVISDGCPVSEISNGAEGVLDTRKAIESCKKAGQIVCGVLLGSGNPEMHQQMFGRNFVHTDNENITRQLSQKLTSLVKEMR